MVEDISDAMLSKHKKKKKLEIVYFFFPWTMKSWELMAVAQKKFIK